MATTPQFKVGDKIRMKEGCSSANTKTGDIKILIENDKGNLCTVGRVGHRCYCKTNWELVEEKPKFKIGDRIKMINSDEHPNDNGRITEIKTITDSLDTDDYICINEDSYNCEHFHIYKDTQWELIEEKSKYKVGQRVKILQAKINSELIGKIRKITRIEDGDIYLEGASTKWGSIDGMKNYLKIVNEPGQSLKQASEAIRVHGGILSGYPNWNYIWDLSDQLRYGYLTTYTNEPNKLIKERKTFMSVIKNAFKSKQTKALSQFEITNGDGGLTSIGQREFVDYLWETMSDEKKSFIEKIVAAYDEDRKNN